MQNKVFVQLYSIVRHERSGHLDAFRALSEIGYDGVELLGNNTNGLSVAEYKALLRELKLSTLSCHNEREYYHLSAVPDSDPLKCAALDYQYLRAL